MTSRSVALPVDPIPIAPDWDDFPPYRRGRRRGQDGYGGGLVALRGAFTMLARAPLGVLTGISVTLELHGASDAGPQLLELCSRLADQYGLEVLPRLDGTTCEVRFNRRPIPGGQAKHAGAASRTADSGARAGGGRRRRSSDGRRDP